MRTLKTALLVGVSSSSSSSSSSINNNNNNNNDNTFTVYERAQSIEMLPTTETAECTNTNIENNSRDTYATNTVKTNKIIRK